MCKYMWKDLSIALIIARNEQNNESISKLLKLLEACLINRKMLNVSYYDFIIFMLEWAIHILFVHFENSEVKTLPTLIPSQTLFV